ncbi:ABC transporter ATP-binding protein [Zavarzinia sp. CC-PAN008]|uniref:ABC transporter ATP-binding protein n=1 Tax=Zavarzinia sp. CC-PAN008 TaxID=3243332 RepID=UPI003F744E8A
MANPLVTLTGLGRRYDQGTLALDGLDLTIGEGEFLSLLGPSGCGKSTVLRLIAGLDRPTAGRIAWHPAPRPLGFVFQEATLMPWANVVANVALPLRLQGVPRAERTRRAEEAIAQVGLAGFETAVPRELSGGMRMRVSLARALVTDARVLLLDEPFAALDEITRFRLNDDLRRLWQARGLTVLFVTHSVFESVYLSTRIVTFTSRPGRVAAVLDLPGGTRDEAFRTSADYAALCRTASAQLAAAMAA